MKKYEEDWINALKMKGLRHILHVSKDKKTNERVLEKAGVKRELLSTASYRRFQYVALHRLYVSILYSMAGVLLNSAPTAPITDSRVY